MKKAKIKGRLRQHVVAAVLGVGAVCGPAGAAEGGAGVYLRGTFGRQTGILPEASSHQDRRRK